MRKTHTSDTGCVYMTLEKTKAWPQSVSGQLRCLSVGGASEDTQTMPLQVEPLLHVSTLVSS